MLNVATASEKDYESACKKSVILTSPSKFMCCLSKNIFPLENLILLVVFENTKIIKCAEYNEVNAFISLILNSSSVKWRI